jgi:peptide/nickel transport system substrate-binding protein
MRMPRRGLISLLLLTIVVACGAPQRPAEQRASGETRPGMTGSSGTKRFVAAIRGFPKSVSPTIDAAGAGSTAGLREVGQLVNVGLTTAGRDGNLVPRLAEAPPTIENGLWKLLPDGRMETTWKIKQGAQWHDGTPFTVEDLLFTTRVAQDPTLTIALDPAFNWIEGARVVDPQTILVSWKQPFIGADNLFSDSSSTSILPMPKHLLEGPYADDKAAFTALPYWGEQFVGTGPFKVKELVPDNHLILEANDRYLLGRPKLDEIEVRFIGDFNVLVANVLAGAVEMNFGRGLSLEQAIEARDQWRDGRMEYAVSNTTALFPQFVNANPTIVTDVRFRRALLHAIDRKQIIDSLQASLSPVAESPLNPSNPDAKEVEHRLVRYAFDPPRARQMIEELGYTRGPDGYYQDRAGQRLTPKIQTTIDDLRQKTMAVIGDHWKEAGVQLESVVIPRQLSSDRQTRSEFATFDFTRQPSDPTRYHSRQAPLAENSYRGNNRGRYMNAEYDALIERYEATIPHAERMQILGDMVHHMTDQLVTMGIFYVVEAILVSNRLVNVGPPVGEDAALQTWNAHEWDVR